MPRIDTTSGEHYRGLGDMVSLAWIAEAARGTDDPISFYANRSGNYDILKLLGQDVSDDSQDPRIVVHDAYLKELKDGGARLRLDYIRDLLGVTTTFRRPQVHLSEHDLAWAREMRGSHESHLVLLFPQTLWESRAWPSCYWIELAWQLKSRNNSVIVMLRTEDKRYKNTPSYLWGFNVRQVAALMSVSTAVVSNDSGPAHLSGTMGVPTLAICGPTRGRCVFGHIPEVIPLASSEAPHCAGCHFQAPFHAACDEGCQSLYALKPAVVLSNVESMLNKTGNTQKRGFLEKLGRRFAAVAPKRRWAGQPSVGRT